jgi:hypothetical protein
MLLDNGADVNTQGGAYGNALQTVCLKGQIEIYEEADGDGRPRFTRVISRPRKRHFAGKSHLQSEEVCRVTAEIKDKIARKRCLAAVSRGIAVAKMILAVGIMTLL